MNMTGVDKLNIRLHPGPLPQERENHSSAASISQVLCLSLVIPPEEPTTGVNSIGFRAIGTSQLLFPLLGERVRMRASTTTDL
jgi:hypothetical protein